ncbi:MAG: hypothetical protein ACKV2Q_09700 [Planctomycetaceae bacterium]
MSDDHESREPSERSANGNCRVALIFVAVLGAYVLSPGPVTWGLKMVGVYDRLESVFRVFYVPLAFLAERFEFISDFYDWQFRVFGL